MKIGFIGLGIMGRPMALNLLKGCHSVTVWARRADDDHLREVWEMKRRSEKTPDGMDARTVTRTLHSARTRAAAPVVEPAAPEAAPDAA